MQRMRFYCSKHAHMLHEAVSYLEKGFYAGGFKLIHYVPAWCRLDLDFENPFSSDWALPVFNWNACLAGHKIHNNIEMNYIYISKVGSSRLWRSMCSSMLYLWFLILLSKSIYFWLRVTISLFLIDNLSYSFTLCYGYAECIS